MSFTKTAVFVLLTLMVSVPAAVMAQTSPYSEVVITTELAAGVSAPSTAPLVTVTATTPTMSGILSSNSSMLSYASSFANDTRTVFFVPGSFAVTATDPGYYFTYSADCSGFTPLNGAARSCLITLSTTPPAPTYNCTAPFYGTAGCASQVVAYNGPYGQSALSCSPSYQTISANLPATFTATGGTPGGYNWTTSDRTTLNGGTSYTTVFQTTGVQTVLVSNGVQTASCTINVVAGNVAINYVGSSNGGNTVYTTTTSGYNYAYNGTPSVTTNYVPAYLPNTGFGPQDGAVFAIAFTLLLSAGIFFFPYVRKALAITLG